MGNALNLCVRAGGYVSVRAHTGKQGRLRYTPSISARVSGATREVGGNDLPALGTVLAHKF